MSEQSVNRCPRCGGELAYDREVERPVRQGNDVAIVSVRADVCRECGELLLHPGMADRLVLAARAIRAGRTAPVLGRVFDFRSDNV